MSSPEVNFAKFPGAHERFRGMVVSWSDGGIARSAAIPRLLVRHISAIATAWAALFLLASLPRIFLPVVPIADASDLLAIVAPYLLIAAAPIAGYLVAARSFPAGVTAAQPDIRLSFYGKWRKLSLLDARAHPVYGPAGFIASLLIGLMLNVVVRSFEFLLAMPALNGHAPHWGQTLFHLMAADVVVMNFFYMVCFVLALRSVPLFPRLLLFTWALDLASQLIIAGQMRAAPELPPVVAGSLGQLLSGNVDKVLISALVWLPYLILSERVNVTYRLRTAA